MKAVGITGTGKYLPSKIIKNDDFVKMGLDTSDEWIMERTGIRERRICEPSMSTSDMGVIAGEQAIRNAGLEPKDIDLVIVATTSADYPAFPSTACLIQHRLGLRNIGAFDVAAACTGFNYALTMGAQCIQTGFCRHVLVIGADCLSKLVDWTDRSVCILFGDGAGAVVLSEVKPGYGILASELHSKGSVGDILITRGGGSREPFSQRVLEEKLHCIAMDGKAVFKLAVSNIVPTLKNTLKSVGLSPADLDLLVPHQANIRIIDLTKDKLNLSDDQVITNLEKYGNTSAASIPIALAEAVEQNRVKEGDLVAFLGFGGGFTWASTLLKWGGIIHE
ncbi:beta-ketoacyl-ACP synthase III [Thermoproteota archaeon]